jgi:hypothetical protein
VRTYLLFLPAGVVPGFSRRVTPAAPFFGFGSHLKCGAPMTRSRIILPVLLLAAVLLADGRAAGLELLSYEDARTALRGMSDSLKAAAAGVSRSKEEAHAVASLGLPDLSANATEGFGEKTRDSRWSTAGQHQFPRQPTRTSLIGYQHVVDLLGRPLFGSARAD